MFHGCGSFKCYNLGTSKHSSHRTWRHMAQFAFADKERKPLGKIATWADFSLLPALNRLKDTAFKNQFYHKTGCMVHALYPVWKLYHLRKTNPELVENTGYISSQINMYLKIDRVPAVSKCTTSGTACLTLILLTGMMISLILSV